MSVILQYQYTRPFCIIRVIFYHYRCRNACQRITNKNLIIGQFIISMSRYLNLIFLNKIENDTECFTHGLDAQVNYT
jgi:hypothetical protein